MKKLIIISLSLFTVSLMFGAAETKRGSEAPAITGAESITIPPKFTERKNLLEILTMDFGMSSSNVESFINNLFGLIFNIGHLNTLPEKFYQQLFALLSWRGVNPLEIEKILNLKAKVVDIDNSYNDGSQKIGRRMEFKTALAGLNKLRDDALANLKPEWKAIIKPLFLLYYALYLEGEMEPEILEYLHSSESFKPKKIENQIKIEYGIEDLWS